jgi:hypothetical protein
VLGVLNYFKLAPSMYRVWRTTDFKSKHVYSVALPERLVRGLSSAVFTHDFRLCFKAVPLSVAGKEDGAPFTFMCEKNNMQQVFQAEVGDEYAVGVPYPMVAVYRKVGTL